MFELTQWILKATIWGICYHHSHFTSGGIEAHRDKIICSVLDSVSGVNYFPVWASVSLIYKMSECIILNSCQQTKRKCRNSIYETAVALFQTWCGECSFILLVSIPTPTLCPVVCKSLNWMHSMCLLAFKTLEFVFLPAPTLWPTIGITGLWVSVRKFFCALDHIPHSLQNVWEEVMIICTSVNWQWCEVIISHILK